MNKTLPTLRQFLVVLLITVQLSWMMHALTGSPFLEVLLRIVFVGMAELLAYTSAGALRQRWLRPSLAKLLAVGLMAPAATVAIFMLTENGDSAPGLSRPELVYGYTVLAFLAAIVGLVAALVALRMESRARDRDDRLQAERERNTLERELLDARLRLLQAQIEPHFLFNTLANIQALVESGSANAAPVLRHLIAYLKAAMPRLNDADATLAGELQLVRAYLELMHMRMPDRLQFSVEAPAELHGVAFPAMALLTLVENAVRHGIDPSTGGGRIEVGGKRDAGGIKLWVSDTGAGMAETSQAGTGLTNLRTRLQAFYGPAARLDLHEVAPHGLRVELNFLPRSAA